MSATSFNNSSSFQFGQPIPSIFTRTDNINYIIFGIPVLLANLLVFAVLISDRKLLQKSAMMAGLTLGNLYLGLHMVSFGIYRLAYDADLWKSTTFYLCARQVFPLIYPLAFNTEALFLILASLERLLAIMVPNWFRLKWTTGNSWLVCLVGHLIAWIMFILGMILPQDTSPGNWGCNIVSIFGVKYTLFLSGFSASAGILSNILTMSTLTYGLYRFHRLPLASGEAGRLNKQVQLSKSMATITLFELGFMSVPNILSLMTNTGYKLPAFIRPQNSTYTNAVNCLVLLMASMVFNSRFRKAAISLLRIEKITGSIMKATVQKIDRAAAIAVQPAVTAINHIA